MKTIWKTFMKRYLSIVYVCESQSSIDQTAECVWIRRYARANPKQMLVCLSLIAIWSSSIEYMLFDSIQVNWWHANDNIKCNSSSLTSRSYACAIKRWCDPEQKYVLHMHWTSSHMKMFRNKLRSDIDARSFVIIRYTAFVFRAKIQCMERRLSCTRCSYRIRTSPIRDYTCVWFFPLLFYI